mmetsp:Transcript_43866/g.98300  ORF Transcript_43866/g.98300 Transcript_43866/m.98300 type:complete len:233 (+) Transcript_43866:211-909(+)
MPCRGKHPLPRGDFVAGTFIMGEVPHLRLLAWHEVDEGHAGVENFGLRLRQLPSLPIPATCFKEQAISVDTIIRLHREVLLLGVEEVEGQGVNGNLVLAREILRGSRGESLREVDTTEPEHHGRPVVHPFLEELETLNEVIDVATKRLQRRVRVFQPHGRGFAIKDLEERCLKISTHEQKALHGLLNVLERVLNHLQEPVEALQLLRQHGVHALFVEGGILLLHLCHIPRLR